MDAARQVTGILALVLWAGLALLLAGCGSGSHSSATEPGISLSRTVPRVPLLDARGRHTDLAAFRGKVVVLSPVLTLCHEVCPLTTGALIEMRQAVERADLGSEVVLLEVSVDPWRDTPARLRAFARRTESRLTLLTGPQAVLRRFWKTFGVSFYRTPEGSPPETDRLAGGEAFDVIHSDGLFFLDRTGRLRHALLGTPDVKGRLPEQLRRLLNDQGLANLRHPEAPWTVREALEVLDGLLGKRLGT